MVDRPKKERGQPATEAWNDIRAKYERLRLVMDERTRRLWVGSEALSYGRGGVTLVSEATGLSRTTVASGLQEVQKQVEEGAASSRIRRVGGGRKRVTDVQPGLLAALEKLVSPVRKLVENYSEFWSALEQISEINRQLLRKRLLESDPNEDRSR